MVYKWKSGSRIKGNAQKSGELFEQLAATEEGLTAETLLTANIPENAPLHGDYEWEDSEAAHQWRLHQSRNFINSLVTVLQENTETEKKPEQVRAFFITTEESKYEPIGAIVKEQTKYDKLLDTAFRELQAFRRKYGTLKELEAVFDAINKAMADQYL